MSRELVIGWKDIASCLGVTTKTAQRWALQRKLPVYRSGVRSIASSRTELNLWKLGDGEHITESMATDMLHELRGWKEICSYLNEPIRTVQLWERTRGLPVRRFPGEHGRVFAMRHELERWKLSLLERKEKANPKAQKLDQNACAAEGLRFL